MWQSLLTPTLVLAGVVVTAAGTYLAVRWQRSGLIRTTDADSLWGALRGELDRMTGEANALRTTVEQLRDEHRLCLETQRAQAAEIAVLRADVARRTAELAAANSENSAEIARLTLELSRATKDRDHDGP